MIRLSTFSIRIVFTLLLFSCENYPGKIEDNRFEVSFQVDQDIYGMTDWAEPPQFALWLENQTSGEIKTIFVTHRTAKDDWEGKASCPVALPFWVSKYKQEYTRERGPSFVDPVPDAYTGATPKNGFNQKFGLPDGEWHCYLEVNVSGDYNDVYKRDFPEEWVHDYGNGQPSIVYKSKDIVSNEEARPFVVIGQTRQVQATGPLLDTVRITSAHKLLKNLALKKM